MAVKRQGTFNAHGFGYHSSAKTSVVDARHFYECHNMIPFPGFRLVRRISELEYDRVISAIRYGDWREDGGDVARNLIPVVEKDWEIGAWHTGCVALSRPGKPCFENVIRAARRMGMSLEEELALA